MSYKIYKEDNECSRNIHSMVDRLISNCNDHVNVIQSHLYQTDEDCGKGEVGSISTTNMTQLINPANKDFFEAKNKLILERIKQEKEKQDEQDQNNFSRINFFVRAIKLNKTIDQIKEKQKNKQMQSEAIKALLKIPPLKLSKHWQLLKDGVIIDKMHVELKKKQEIQDKMNKGLTKMI